MFLLYLDASGTVELADATKHYVLLGIAVHENTWFAFNKRVKGLKKKYAYPGEDFELHAKDFCRSIHEQEQVQGFDQMEPHQRRSCIEDLWRQKLVAVVNPDKRKSTKKEHRRVRPFIHMTRAERSQLYEDALSLVAGHSGLVLFAEAIDKNHPSVINGVIDCTCQAFAQVLSRFDAFLRRKAEWKRLSTNRLVSGNKGLIVMDRHLETEKEIEEQFADYQNKGHPWGQLEYVIDAPFFVDSMKIAGIQLSDICAYAVRRYLDKGALVNTHEERHFKTIFDLFDRSNGKLHGIRHYTQPGTCHCLICAERGHSG